MKISLGSWAFTFGPYSTHPVPLEQVVARLSEVGYDGIELSGFPPHVSLEEYRSEEARRLLRDRLSGANLQISGYAPDLSLVNPCAAGNNQRYLELFDRNVELCAALGSPMIRVDSGTAPEALDEEVTAAAMSRLADVWHHAAGIAARSGVSVAWEFEPSFVFHRPSEVVALHRQVGHANFRVLFDTAHAHTCSAVGARQRGRKETLAGGIADFLKLLEGRIGHVHLVDSDGTLYEDETSRHCPFGEGQVPFFNLAQKLRSAGAAWWCVDLCFCEGSWEQVEPSLKYVRSLSRASSGGY